jgi:hypothetical protein
MARLFADHQRRAGVIGPGVNQLRRDFNRVPPDLELGPLVRFSDHDRPASHRAHRREGRLVTAPLRRSDSGSCSLVPPTENSLHGHAHGVGADRSIQTDDVVRRLEIGRDSGAVLDRPVGAEISS